MGVPDVGHFVISDFLREVDENYYFLSLYVASSGNLLQTFRDNI